MTNSSAKFIAAFLLLAGSSVAMAQDIRYSWFEVAFVQQDVDEDGSFTDSLIGQTVDISTADGSGTKFRGSVGTWHNLYAFVDFSSSDIGVDALVTNAQGEFPTKGEFDLTSVRGGIGFKWSVTLKTDIIAEIGLDSVDYDFGSFAGEDFDFDEQDIGGALGVRSMLTDNLELRAHARYTNIGDVNLTEKFFDSEVLFGVGLGYTLIRGLSITLDYETGLIETLSLGFRLDFDED